MQKDDLSPHTADTVLRFLDAAAALELRLDRALSNTKGISFGEYRLLSVIAEAAPRGVSRIDLASRVGLTASAITRALKPLEKLRFVKTVRNERDARQSLATITPGGLALLEDARGIVADVLRDLPLNSLGEKKRVDFCARLDELAHKP